MSATATASAPARLAAAFAEGPDLVSQAVAVLRSIPEAAELRRYDLTDPALLPVGAADRALLAAHEQLTGRPLDHTAECPACGGLTTFALGSADVTPHTWMSAWLGPGEGLREPTYADLLAASGDVEALLVLCSVGPADSSRATVADLDRIEGSLSGPLRAACAECGAPLVVDVDVIELVLAALAVVCADLDRDIHLLASAYGWDLATIESLPTERRQRLAGLITGVAG